MVGGRLAVEVNDAWTLMVRGDVSGFGIDGASTLTWNLVGGGQLRINRNFLMRFAYRAQGIDYDNDVTGPSQIGIDVTIHGPYLGFVLNF
jgi:hypothetical protein